MPPDKADSKPTNAELEILNVLWRLGSGTVRDVQAELAKSRAVGYTTALKIMQIMFDKGLLTRAEHGKAHIYSPVATADRTRTNLVDDLMDRAFGGSAKMLVQHALGGNRATAQELQEIRAFLDQMENDR